mmetsp:Transcript_58375/g.137557  ORF Transcript_58375/g.137557 Transcript_58375/m.137557 type:complete len:227 (-) Transcript_58375:154-834(-)
MVSFALLCRVSATPPTTSRLSAIIWSEKSSAIAKSLSKSDASGRRSSTTRSSASIHCRSSSDKPRPIWTRPFMMLRLSAKAASAQSATCAKLRRKSPVFRARSSPRTAKFLRSDPHERLSKPSFGSWDRRSKTRCTCASALRRSCGGRRLTRPRSPSLIARCTNPSRTGARRENATTLWSARWRVCRSSSEHSRRRRTASSTSTAPLRLRRRWLWSGSRKSLSCRR